MNRFLAKNRKYILSSAFIIVFLFTIIHNIPSWVLANEIQTYSEQRLKLYDTHGTFWNGGGLLVALDQKHKNASPLMYIDWDIKLGLTKYIDIKFNLGDKNIADIYLNKKGLNVDKLDLSLAITQVSQLFGPLKDLNISGNVRVTTNHMTINKKIDGIFTVNLENVSSGLSRVNPLGSYTVSIDAGAKQVDITSVPGSTLMLNGNGTFNGLTVSARVDEAKKEDMLQFITIMGVPTADGSYRLKIF